MKKQLLIALSLIIISGLTVGMAQDALAGHEIVGAPKCKSCHKKIGDPYSIWADTQHAKAYETLGTPEAKKIAADKGLGDPQKEEACLKCHVTQAFLGRDVAINAKAKYVDTEGVGCEACHGAGSDYKKKKVMKDHDAAVAAGLIVDKSEANCTKCHNSDSPTFKEFDFEKQWDAIKHPVVAKKK
jgi:hypothetical protein